MRDDGKVGRFSAIKAKTPPLGEWEVWVVDDRCPVPEMKLH